MTKIFISYRRQDSQYVTDSVHEFMIRYFGLKNVFLDVSDIPIGVDVYQYLTDQIVLHDVVLVIIGPDWVRIMKERANEHTDFVRIEIEYALRQKKLVIPVLVMDAKMPNFNDLPDSIADLGRINPANIRRKPDLEDDCQHLAEDIRKYFALAALPHVAQVATLSSSADANVVREIIGEPFEWCEVPAGEFKYGDYSIPLLLNVSRFFIAKYPITYSQFQRFIDANDGYNDSRWWNGLAIATEHWANPEEQKHQYPLHPRERVSWYEAMAFCRWLSFRLGDNYNIEQIDSWKARLPTEFEWAKAARGIDKRLYPFGEKFDKTKCNSLESGFDSTTPVTLYPDGVSPYGVQGMSGNVHEWCLTGIPSERPAIHASSEDITSPLARIFRGGSFDDNESDVRTTSRGSIDATARGINLGFRICF